MNDYEELKKEHDRFKFKNPVYEIYKRRDIFKEEFKRQEKANETMKTLDYLLFISGALAVLSMFIERIDFAIMCAKLFAVVLLLKVTYKYFIGINCQEEV